MTAFMRKMKPLHLFSYTNQSVVYDSIKKRPTNNNLLKFYIKYYYDSWPVKKRR